jgi:predicted dehydrogenase
VAEGSAVKILIAGLGGIGQRHARNLRAILGDDLELIAWRVRGLSHVITPTLQADDLRNVETQYNIHSFDMLAQALSEKPDAAFVCNPTSLHVSTAQACAEAGCHLFLEKPVSHNTDGLEALAQAAQGRVVLVGYQLRFHPVLRALAQLLHEQAVGRVLAVRAVIGEYLPGWHAYEDYRQMYAARAALGGGVILSQIHEFDYLYSLFGMPHSVYALGGHWSSLDIDVEDTASILMNCSLNEKPLAIHLHQDYVQRPASRQCEIIGDRGKIVADFGALRVTSPKGVQEFAGFDRNQLFLDQTKHFLACISGRETPLVDLHGGIQSLRMALAAKESIATGHVVNL